jgi:hypothetical protein
VAGFFDEVCRRAHRAKRSLAVDSRARRRIIPPRLLERSTVYYVLIGKVASNFVDRQAVKPKIGLGALTGSTPGAAIAGVTLADLTTANFHDLLNDPLGAWPWIAQQLTKIDHTVVYAKFAASVGNHLARLRREACRQIAEKLGARSERTLAMSSVANIRVLGLRAAR